MRITQLLALALKLNHHHVQNGPYLVVLGRGKLDYHVDEYAAGYLPTVGKSGSNQVIQSINPIIAKILTVGAASRRDSRRGRRSYRVEPEPHQR